jgi:hypothetical protein
MIQRCDDCTRSLTQVHWVQASSVHNGGGHQRERFGILVEITPSMQEEKSAGFNIAQIVCKKILNNSITCEKLECLTALLIFSILRWYYTCLPPQLWFIACKTVNKLLFLFMATQYMKIWYIFNTLPMQDRKSLSMSSTHDSTRPNLPNSLSQEP